jgi:uncharacterized protein DUF6655
MIRPSARCCRCAWAIALISAAGCGINKSRLATEQLVVSEAVDKAVATIDFSPLSGKRVYFDTQYLADVNMGPNGNVKYVISSIRQQMLAYDLRLQEKADTAEFVVEGRIGVLANDGAEVTYGIPGGAAVVSATALLATPMPTSPIPELSVGRRNHQAGTAKIGLFAYDRVTREPVWQAGVRRGTSDMRDTWFLGLGPYHYRPQRSKGFWRKDEEPHGAQLVEEPLRNFSGPIVFQRAVRPSASAPPLSPPAVAPVNHQQWVPPLPLAAPQAAPAPAFPPRPSP